eukprot:476960_1
MASPIPSQSLTAVVTGASQGIGADTVKRLISMNWNVIMISRSSAKMQKVAQSRIKSDDERKQRIKIISFDLSKPETIETVLIPEIRSFTNNGAIDLLVNNAGGNFHVTESSVKSTTLNSWNSTINLNLTSVFLLIKGLRTDFIQSSYPASIVNIGSVLSNYPELYSLPYGVAKRGLQMLTKAYAIYYGKYNIRVNSIDPGYIETPAHDRIYKDNHASVSKGNAELTPLGRCGETKDIVEGIIYLSDPNQSSFITGQTITIDGGFTLPLVHTRRKIESKI